MLIFSELFTGSPSFIKFCFSFVFFFFGGNICKYFKYIILANIMIPARVSIMARGSPSAIFLGILLTGVVIDGISLAIKSRKCISVTIPFVPLATNSKGILIYGKGSAANFSHLFLALVLHES